MHRLKFWKGWCRVVYIEKPVSRCRGQSSSITSHMRCIPFLRNSEATTRLSRKLLIRHSLPWQRHADAGTVTCVNRFERSNGLVTALYKNYLYLFFRYIVYVDRTIRILTKLLNFGHYMSVQNCLCKCVCDINMSKLCIILLNTFKHAVI